MGNKAKHIFRMPFDPVSGTFNGTATGEGRAVPVYDDPETQAKDLASLPNVVAALAIMQSKGRRLSAMYAKDVEDYLETSEPFNDDATRAFKVLTGKSKDGFGISVLRVQGNDGTPTYLFALEDQLRKKLVLLGSEDISPKLAMNCAAKGVTYLRRDTAAAEHVNNFLASAARYRYENLDRDVRPYSIMEDMIRGVSLTAECPRVIRAGTTVGDILCSVQNDAAIYVSMMKPAAR